MILELFNYYARFPDREGVKGIFAQGRSARPQYRELLDTVNSLPEHGRLPGIDHLVFGQTFDSVKARIDSITGTYLYVEFGAMESSRDAKNSIQDRFRVYVSIAGKIDSNCDLVEQAIIAEETLMLMNRLRAIQHKDSESTPWLSEISYRHNISPFVFKEFSSVGWTISFEREGADMLGLKETMKTI